jgi:hypothetical protein
MFPSQIPGPRFEAASGFLREFFGKSPKPPRRIPEEIPKKTGVKQEGCPCPVLKTIPFSKILRLGLYSVISSKLTVSYA